MSDENPIPCLSCEVPRHYQGNGESELCEWFTDNVILGTLSVYDCVAYKPVRKEDP